MDKSTIKAILVGAGATFLGTYLYNMYKAQSATQA